MTWVILIAIIFVVLFVMILVPKATKGYTGKDNLTEVAWAKGFKRIYFVGSALWMVSTAVMFFAEDGDWPKSAIIPLFLIITAPVPIYYFIKWIFSGFKKDKKKKK